MSLDYLRSVLPFLLDGLQTTFLIWGVSLAGGLLLGIVLAVLRLSRRRTVTWLAGAYVNGMRALPLLLLIFWFYFLVPLIVGRPGCARASAWCSRASSCTRT